FAVSRSALVSALVFFFMIHLLYRSLRQRPGERRVIRLEPARGDFAQCRELVILDVRLCALGKTKEEDRASLRPIGDQHPVTARAALARPRHPLLDDPAAQIRVDQAALGTPHRLRETGIRDALASRKPREALGLKHPHASPPALRTI